MTLLRRLEQVKDRFDESAAETKLAILEELESRTLGTAAAVQRLHETLCFLRAYPDSSSVLQKVETLLGSFDARRDLKRHARELADTGISGTPTYYRFFWVTAKWLARNWPDRITIDWSDFDHADEVPGLLPLLMPYAESPTCDMLDFTPRKWIEQLKGAAETDAAFLIRRFAALDASLFIRESLYENLDVPVCVEPGPTTPSRSRARYRPSPVTYQDRPLDRSRPDVMKDVKRPRVKVRSVAPAAADELIDLAREAMVTRSRDLDAFANADRNDVRLVDCGDGLQFVCYGTQPERRLVLETTYGFLTLKNGVPIGYVLLTTIFGCTEVAYNVFESFRGGEAARVFGKVLETARVLFASTGFSIDPYQLGHGNAEGLKSGAWWFYYKMGFRPRDPDILKLLHSELKRMKKDRSHRSSEATLEVLSSDYLYLTLTRSQERVLGSYSLGHIGLKVTRYLAERFGADRETGIATCRREAARLLKAKTNGITAGERFAWERWSPIIAMLPDLESWPPADRKALAAVVRAKGGRRESVFVPLLEGHKRLRRALLKFARED